jgi:hypothetical protein
MALLTLDAARWSDSVVAREQSGELVLTLAAELVHGQLSSFSPPLPAPGADWRAWAAWANDGSVPPEDPGGPPAMRIEPEHNRIARFVKAQRGRDIVSEWQQQLAAAPDDSARYVFERLLLPFHRWTPPPLDSIATQLRLGDPFDYARGINGFDPAFAQVATQAEVVNRILSYVMDGDPLWPTIKPSWDTLPHDSTMAGAERGRGLAGEAPRPVFVYVNGLPALVRARWGDRVMWVSDSTWQVPKERYPASLIAINAVESAGPFLRVRWSHLRYPGLSESDIENESTVLIRTAGGWVIVALDFFYTSD